MNQAISNKQITDFPISADPSSSFFIHAGAVLTPEGVILLLGHSSSGKTTLCSMLSSCFPVVADDITFAFRQENKAWAIMNGNVIKSELVGDNGFSKSTFQKKLPSYPLHSVIRVFAAHTTELKPLPTIKICEYLVDAAFEIDVQRKAVSPILKTQWFRLTAAMARQHAGWRLQFSFDAKSILSSLQNMILKG